MNITATDKVLLGITVAIATVAAGAVHLWLVFVVLIASAVVAIALKRFSAGKVGEAKTATQKPAGANTTSIVINPATVMPMGGTVDARGNLYGQNEACGTNVYGRHDG